MKRVYSLILIGVLLIIGISFLSLYSLPKIIFIGYEGPALRMLKDASGSTGIKTRQILHQDIQKEKLSKYKVIFLRAHGANITDSMANVINIAKKKGSFIIATGNPNDPGVKLSNVDLRAHPNLFKYWEYGGAENYRRFLVYCSVNFLKSKKAIQEPLPTPTDGIYHPESKEVFISYEDYLSWYKKANKFKENAGTIVIDPAGDWQNGDTFVADALIRNFETRGINVIALFGREKKEELILKAKPDLIIYNFSMPPRWLFGKAPGFLKENNLLLITTPSLRIGSNFSKKEWQENPRGMSCLTQAVAVSVPELDGAIEPIIIDSMEEDENGFKARLPIEERIKKLTDRAVNWIKLRKKPNSEKKAAIVYFKAPGRGEFGGAGLDFAPSMVNFLTALKSRGFKLEAVPNTSQELLNLIDRSGRNIGSWAEAELESMVREGKVALIRLDRFNTWLKEKLPDKNIIELRDKYGQPPGDLMVYEKDGEKFIVVPMVNLGNVILLPQPQRGASQGDTLIHSDKVPPPYQYLAVYFWLEEEFKADAIVHFGTHGNLEFLPGKQLGLSGEDWPDIAIGNLPHLYLYTMDDVGEALTAKRRSYAAIVSHLTPPIVASELYGELRNLDDALHKYEESDDEIFKAGYQKLIKDMTKNLKIDIDLSLTDISNRQLTEEEIKKIDTYLHTVEAEKMPLGLHIYGRLPDNNKLIPLIIEMLGKRFWKDLSESGLHFEEAHLPRESAQNILLSLLVKGSLQEEVLDNFGLKPTKELDEDFIKAKEYFEKFKVSTESEINVLLTGLEGGYILPGQGGDPVRNPNALPAGKNLYGINPDEVPTKVAWEVGVRLADSLLAKKIGESGDFPKKVGFNLWSTETVRDLGVLESEILHLLGIRPVWSERNQVIDVELIPDDELKRPRIDVVVQASGQYRDIFPSRMELIDKAIKLANDAKGKDNYVYEGTLKMEEELKEKGFSPKEAKELSQARIFGAPSGMYGTGLIGAITDRSGDWDNTKELTKGYTNRSGAVYTKEKWGVFFEGVYEAGLNRTEAVIHGRSSNLYGPMSLDHVFEYMGGMTMAIRDITGKDPKGYFSDTRNVANPFLQDLSEALRVEARARLFNPKWIEGMKDHGFSGASQFAEMTKNLFGWQVTKPDIVKEDLWEETFKVYVQDKYNLQLRRWFDKENPHAFQALSSLMIEAIRKGYWSPSQDLRQELTNAYTDSLIRFNAACSQRVCANKELEQFVKEALNAPGNVSGRQLLSRYEAALTKVRESSADTKVEGYKMKKVKEMILEKARQKTVVFSVGSVLGILAIALLFGYGFHRKR